MYSAGYTLVELLVAISIIAIFSTIGFVNFKNFSQDQVIIKASNNLHSMIRLAQANGSSGVLCGTSPALSWRLNFANNKPNEIELVCELPDKTISRKKTEVLEGVTITEIKGNSCLSPSFPQETFYIMFKSTGIQFLGDGCMQDSQSITIKMKDSQTEVIKSIIFSKGGSVDVQ